MDEFIAPKCGILYILNMISPHPIWTAAGTNPVSVRKATIVTWLLLNVYKTGERLFKMKKVKTPQCDLCLESLETQLHFALKCGALLQIRSQYMERFVAACPNITQYISNQRILFLAILDPYSPILPEDINKGLFIYLVIQNWPSLDPLPPPPCITVKGRSDTKLTISRPPPPPPRIMR